jgi:hypothetical protein
MFFPSNMPETSALTGKGSRRLAEKEWSVAYLKRSSPEAPPTNLTDAGSIEASKGQVFMLMDPNEKSLRDPLAL